MIEAARKTSIDPQEVEQFSRIADEWWDKNGKFKPLHRINPLRISYIKQQIERHFAKPMHELSLADIGCGGGLISEPMAECGLKVTGVDASEKNIKVASLHAEKSALTIRYLATSAEELAAKGESFDIVLALEIIEHVADLDVFYNALSALVKPNGMLILSTINRTAKSYAMAIIGAEYVMRWLPKGTHDWAKFVKPSEMARALTTRGMQIHESVGMNFNPLEWKFSINNKDLDVNYLMVATKP
ncbi:MAG: bifunctional 2-polyprenyl-6-hydroxyphenol methylase/3-demethylubiquinol 3-O-methyltransferase UbiG [Alphaproteobacteria bacterium]|nr:bifunctional 2-polyprenyl-6-hydroxyphenol methylase/3-demethylubiquinol 3-O-methyltransferase UbiG [Alphaproteobacteria bacterium]